MVIQRTLCLKFVYVLIGLCLQGACYVRGFSLLLTYLPSSLSLIPTHSSSRLSLLLIHPWLNVRSPLCFSRHRWTQLVIYTLQWCVCGVRSYLVPGGGGITDHEATQAAAQYRCSNSSHQLPVSHDRQTYQLQQSLTLTINHFKHQSQSATSCFF